MHPEAGDRLELKLQGRTLQVYLYLIKKSRPIGIRELQRDLGLSSPSVAEYQIEKLIELGIAQKDVHGQARIVKRVKLKALDNYLEFGPKLMLPRISLYAFIFTAVTSTYLVTSWNSLNLFAIILSFSATGIFWFEALRAKIRIAKEVTPSENTLQMHLSRYFWHSLAPGLIGLAAFVAVAGFLYYYVAPFEPTRVLMSLPPSIANSNDPTAEPSPMSYASSPSVEYSAEMSAKKVAQAGPSDRIILSPAPELYVALALAAAAVLGFIIFLIVKYRSIESYLEYQRVLMLKQVSILSFGEQDFHAR